MLRKVSFFCCLCFLFITGPVLAQQKKIIPKKGEIVFTSQGIILDEAKFKASTKDMQKKMMDVLKSKLATEGNETVDTTLINQFTNSDIDFLGSFMKNTEKEVHFIYEDSIIKSFENISILESVIDTSFKRLTLIDQNKSSYIVQQVFEGDTSESEPISFEYQHNDDITIKEFREEQKNINGFRCFKVIYQYKGEFEGDEELRSIFTNTEHSTTEFWVTEEIQSLFHPICRVKEILTKYYPLEIKEYSSVIKGFVLSHKLKSITLSN